MSTKKHNATRSRKARARKEQTAKRSSTAKRTPTQVIAGTLPRPAGMPKQEWHDNVLIARLSHALDNWDSGEPWFLDEIAQHESYEEPIHPHELKEGLSSPNLVANALAQELTNAGAISAAIARAAQSGPLRPGQVLEFSLSTRDGLLRPVN